MVLLKKDPDGNSIFTKELANKAGYPATVQGTQDNKAIGRGCMVTSKKYKLGKL